VEQRNHHGEDLIIQVAVAAEPELLEQLEHLVWEVLVVLE
tara:strand:- start:423 stop:542 length:120 start_codon:yes stop_codon:yes gene_type:complete